MPRPNPVPSLPQRPRPLDNLSIEELEEYIVELKGEIARAEQMIAAKRDFRGAADAVFKF